MNSSARDTPTPLANRRVLILGARGRLGLACAKAFVDAGWQVFGLIRPGARTPVQAGVEWIAMDMADASALAARLGQVGAVVHAINPPYTNGQWQRQSGPLLAQAIDIAVAIGGVLLFPGNVYNFGAAMPPVLAPATAQRPNTAKGRIRMALEAQLRVATEQRGLRAAVIRAGDFFGSGVGTWFDRSIAAGLPKAQLVHPGVDGVSTAWAYLPDLARAFERVATERARLGAWQVFHFAGHCLSPKDWCDVFAPIAAEQGWLRGGASLKRKTLPWGLIKALGWLVPSWGAAAEMHYLWTTPHRLDNTSLVALIGAEPGTPLHLAAHNALLDLGLLKRSD